MAYYNISVGLQAVPYFLHFLMNSIFILSFNIKFYISCNLYIQ